MSARNANGAKAPAEGRGLPRRSLALALTLARVSPISSEEPQCIGPRGSISTQPPPCIAPDPSKSSQPPQCNAFGLSISARQPQCIAPRASISTQPPPCIAPPPSKSSQPPQCNAFRPSISKPRPRCVPTTASIPRRARTPEETSTQAEPGKTFPLWGRDSRCSPAGWRSPGENRASPGRGGR